MAGERENPIQEATPSLAEVPVVSSPANGNGKARYCDLKQTLEKYREKNHLIVLQGTPDPDAISSALALEAISQLFEINCTILTFAALSHHENRALVKRLEIQMIQYDEAFDVKTYDIYSIVDSQKAYTPIDARLQDFGVDFVAFIDHHKETVETPPAAFVDVRPHFGSTAAILCEYLMEAFPKGLEPSEEKHVRLATALLHGMRSDTKRLTYATKAEYDAAAFIAACIDNKAIDYIERRILTSSMLGVLENSLVNRKMHDNFIFSDVGFVRPVDRDVIPQAAELLLSREGTDTVLVYGLVDEKFIDGSFRTRSETINPDEFVKGFLGASPQSGRYYGGGNTRDRGGFQIPLGFLSLHADKEQVYQMAREIMEKSFLDYIGKTSTKSN